MRTSSIWQGVPSKPSSIWDIVRWKISEAELIPNGSLLKQKCPNGVTKVGGNFDLSSKGICQNPLLVSSLGKILLSPSSFTEGIGCISIWTALLKWVRSTQIRTLPFWFKDRDDTCTPFSWSCYRRDHSLLKHCFYLTFYFWNQWMGNLSWIVETERLRIRANCYVAFSPQLSQSAEERWKFSFEIYWPHVHLFDILWALVQHRLSCWVTSTSDHAPHIYMLG